MVALHSFLKARWQQQLHVAARAPNIRSLADYHSTNSFFSSRPSTMVADLCCATEQDSRSSSPELPNARVTQATPARQPLLPKNTTSPNSRYTSVGSEDLRELRNIFDHARDSESDQQSKAKPPAAHKHFHRPSMISLRSIHNVASMRSILRRPFSKQALAQKPLLGQPQVDLKTLTTTPDTVVKQPGFEHKGDLFNKDALKKHLLSDKKPDEGGYDFDAEVLEDMAKNLGKKASGKRPSIHSIEWSPSTGRYVSSQSDLQDTFMDVSQSKSTPVSSTKDRHSAGPKRDITPYDVEKSQMSSMSLRLSHIFSAPILRPDKSPVNKGKLKHSASMVSSSVVLSTPCRLPTLPTTDTDGIPWAERINESLRLSQCSVTSPLPGTEASETRVAVAENTKKDMRNDVRNQSANHTTLTEPGSPLPVIKLDLKLHRTTHRASLQDITFGNSAPDVREHIAKGEEDENSDDPRRSVHLHNMRISHHLRSGSLLSWDQFSNTSELPSPCTIRERAVSDQSRVHQARNARHERQTSSSGFGSSKVPSRWGIVLAYDRDYAGDVASSIYSSRPQSPPDSLANLSYACVGHTTFSMSSMDSRKHRRSMSLPLDSDRTPRALDGQDHSTPVPESKAPSFPDLTFDSPGRTKSVSETKRSKFQEEFTSSPSKRKLTSSTSLMRLLDPRRLSLRSHDDAHQSESGTKLIKESSNSRRQSRSSNQTKNEREGSVASKGVDDVWDQALKAYQKEKASMFFPENQSQALTGSLYRDRRASLTAKRSSVATIEHTDQQRNPSIALSSPSPGTTRPEYFTDISSRRDALTRSDGANATQDISNAFNKQGDSTKVVGAWGRYPSHNRDDRNVACKVDHVDTRDFALESTLGSMSTWGGQHDADMVDPLESPDRTHTKRKGTGFIKKSQTMTFGKQFLKNYSRIFKSQSVEFRKHGQGHRSSIASSGVLEYPELELLPEPWNERSRIRRSSRLGLFDGEDSTSTLRPPMHPSRRSSAPDMSELYSNDSVFDSEPGQDRARFWSVYYENCVPTFPRMSSDLNNVFDGLEEQVRDSADSRVTVVPGAWPNTSPSHPLNTEAEDPDHAPPRRSSLPRPAFPPNYKLDAQPNPGNVRRSTLDLISQFKEQEKEEHEKILALARSKSQSQPNVS